MNTVQAVELVLENHQDAIQDLVHCIGLIKMERYQRVHYFGTLKETGREEDREIAGEDR